RYAPVCRQQNRSPCGPDMPVWPEGGRQECLLRFAPPKKVVRVGQTFLSGQREADKNVCPGLPTPKTLSVCGPDIPVWPEGRRQECLLRFAHSKNVVHVRETFLSRKREAHKNLCSALPHQKPLSVWARNSCLAKGRQTRMSAPHTNLSRRVCELRANRLFRRRRVPQLHPPQHARSRQYLRTEEARAPIPLRPSSTDNRSDHRVRIRGRIAR